MEVTTVAYLTMDRFLIKFGATEGVKLKIGTMDHNLTTKCQEPELLQPDQQELQVSMPKLPKINHVFNMRFWRTIGQLEIKNYVFVTESDNISSKWGLQCAPSPPRPW